MDRYHTHKRIKKKKKKKERNLKEVEKIKFPGVTPNIHLH